MLELFEAAKTIDSLSKKVDALEKEIKAARGREALLLRRFSNLERALKDANTEHRMLRSHVAQVQQQKSR